MLGFNPVRLSSSLIFFIISGVIVIWSFSFFIFPTSFVFFIIAQDFRFVKMFFDLFYCFSFFHFWEILSFYHLSFFDKFLLFFDVSVTRPTTPIGGVVVPPYSAGNFRPIFGVFRHCFSVFIFWASPRGLRPSVGLSERPA